MVLHLASVVDTKLAPCGNIFCNFLGYISIPVVLIILSVWLVFLFLGENKGIICLVFFFSSKKDHLFFFPFFLTWFSV